MLICMPTIRKFTAGVGHMMSAHSKPTCQTLSTTFDNGCAATGCKAAVKWIEDGVHLVCSATSSSSHSEWTRPSRARHGAASPVSERPRRVHRRWNDDEDSHQPRVVVLLQRIETDTNNQAVSASTCTQHSRHKSDTQSTGLLQRRVYRSSSLQPSACDLRRLQSVLNTAVRLVTGASRREHVTPLLRDRHWLPIQQRVDYKLCMMVHRCLSGSAPSYLSTSSCRLQSPTPEPDWGRRRQRPFQWQNQCHAPIPHWEIVHSQSRLHVHGTNFRPSCATPLLLALSAENWKLFYLTLLLVHVFNFVLLCCFCVLFVRRPWCDLFFAYVAIILTF